MLDKQKLRDLIDATLKGLEEKTGGLIKCTEEARELLMMTCAHESHLGTYRKQIGGPALGIFQMEPATFKDLQENFIAHRKVLKDLVGHRKPEELVEDDVLAIMMARIHYFRYPESIPKDPVGMSELAKKRYNTVAGKATAEKYLQDYQKYA